MEGDELAEFLVTKQPILDPKEVNNDIESDADDKKTSRTKREPLTTKNAIKLLLEGTLKSKVCRYCLNVDSVLYEIDQIFHIGGRGAIYKVSVREMVACFHPFQVLKDTNFPTKICDQCLDNAIHSYLFTQQCEQASRALRNCFEDMYDKLDKLDPLEPPTKKRGRQKANPNHNTLYAEHETVINYADPLMNIINIGSELIEGDNQFNEFECSRCWQKFTTLESLLNHEKIHPKYMWFNCSVCGKSFPKRHLYRKHIRTVHETTKQVAVSESGFRCLDCNVDSETYDQHLQHIEKHKFCVVMEHLIEKKMDKLCTVCLSKGVKMVKLDKTVNIHGGCPELTGQRSLYNILGSTMPEMNILSTYTGTKICAKCIDHALISYIFLNHAHYVRNRLKTCVDLMLGSLKSVTQTRGKIFVEISQNVILPPKEPDYVDESLFVEAEEQDESKLKVEVLEDEFRTKDSDSDSDDNKEATVKIKSESNKNDPVSEFEDFVFNPARNITKSYSKGMVNGLQTKFTPSYKSISNVSEFLTFKNKTKPKPSVTASKFTCPLCSKYFISDYFLRRHITKHVLKKVQCKTCKEQFQSKFYLYEHIKMAHLLKNTNHSLCKACGRCYVNKKKFIKHVRTHKSKKCDLCDKYFATQTHYNNHMERHAVKLKHIRQSSVQTCSFCELSCSNDNELSLHVNKAHLQIKPYSCDMCDRQFYSEINLNCHKKVHSMYSKESCNFCSKNLKSRKALVIHVRKHIGAKPYSCQICQQSFYSQGRLRNHLKIFHGGKFYCKLCKTVFANKCGLKDHVNTAHNSI